MKMEDGMSTFKYGLSLYAAALKGDWKTARKIHSKHPNCFAAVARRPNACVHIMNLFVEFATNDLAEMKNSSLCVALASGTVTVAREMICVQPELPLIRSRKGLTPLHMATLLGHREMVKYLLPLTLDNLSNKDLIYLFNSTITTELYVKRNGSHKENDLQLFKALLLVVRLWDEVLRHRRDCNSVPKLMSRHPWKLLFTAVEVGNVEFVTTILSSYPDLIWKLNDDHQSILHVAVQYRQEKIFRLVLEMDVVKDLLAVCVNDSNGNNILHLVGLLPSPDVIWRPRVSAIIAIHREMLWFKGIEDLVQPHLALARNFDGETPRTLFTKEHQNLMKEGEYWMSDTAKSCISTAILITFVVLIAALRSFVKPFSNGAWYRVFAIFDSMSLLSSIASTIVFSSILTSNFAEEDFLYSLPRKLMVGLTLLIISIATLVIALAATLPFIFEFGWLYLGTSGVACLPIIVFSGQDLPRLLKVYREAIGCNFIFKPQHHQLFQ